MIFFSWFPFQKREVSALARGRGKEAQKPINAIFFCYILFSGGGGGGAGFWVLGSEFRPSLHSIFFFSVCCAAERHMEEGDHFSPWPTYPKEVTPHHYTNDYENSACKDIISASRSVTQSWQRIMFCRARRIGGCILVIARTSRKTPRCRHTCL